jgi:hypothetical protein
VGLRDGEDGGGRGLAFFVEGFGHGIGVGGVAWVAEGFPEAGLGA